MRKLGERAPIELPGWPSSPPRSCIQKPPNPLLSVIRGPGRTHLRLSSQIYHERGTKAAAYIDRGDWSILDLTINVVDILNSGLED